HLRLLLLTGMLSMMPCSCVECAGWLLPVALHPAERDQREHREPLHLRFACLLDGFPERRRPTWHEGAHGNSSRDEIAKRHHGADFFDFQMRELFLEALPVAVKDYPGQSAVGVR